MKLAIAAALALFGGCGAPRASAPRAVGAPAPELGALPPGWTRPPPAGDAIDVPVALARQARRLIERIEQVSAKGDRVELEALVALPTITLSWGAGELHPLTIEMTPIAPMLDGVLADVRVVFHNGVLPSRQLLFLGPDDRGRWRLQDTPSDAALRRATITRSVNELALSKEHHRIAGHTTLDIQAAGWKVMPLELDLSNDRAPRVAVEQDGEPCRVAVTTGIVLVELRRPVALAHLDVRYEWTPPNTENAYINEHSLALRGAWPTVLGPNGEVTVSVLHDPALHLIASGDVNTEPASEGWSRTTVHSLPNSGGRLLIAGRRDAQVRTFEVAGVEVRLLLGASQDDPREREALVRRALEASPLAYPFDHVSIFERDDDSPNATTAMNMITMPRAFDNFGTLVHELAHGVFPFVVLDSLEARHASPWHESLAEWIASLVDPDANYDTVVRYEEIAGKLYDLALVDPRVSSLPLEIQHALRYSKGVLVLRTLEVDLGRAQALELWKRFAVERAGKLTTWSDLIDHVRRNAGEDPARRFRAWLERPGAPTFGLEHVTVAGKRLRGVIVQSGDGPFVETAVEIATERDLDFIGTRTRLIARGPSTPFDIALPKGANAVRLDPDRRLPNAYVEGVRVWVPLDE